MFVVWDNGMDYSDHTIRFWDCGPFSEQKVTDILNRFCSYDSDDLPNNDRYPEAKILGFAEKVKWDGSIPPIADEIPDLFKDEEILVLFTQPERAAVFEAFKRKIAEHKEWVRKTLVGNTVLEVPGPVVWVREATQQLRQNIVDKKDWQLKELKARLATVKASL